MNAISPGNRLTVGRPTAVAVTLHALPWLVAMATVFVGSFAHRGGLSLSGGLSLLCFAAIVLPLVVQSDRVDLRPGLVQLRSWWSILQEKPGEEIALGTTSSLYRDTLGRIFVDHREIRLYLGLGWRPVASWFERSGLSVFDDQDDLGTRGGLLDLGSRARWPIGAALYLAALLTVWAEPDLFSVTVFGIGVLLLTYYFMFHGRRFSRR